MRLPEGWKNGCLGDMVSLQRGHDLPESERRDGEFPIVSAAGKIGFHDQYTALGPGVVIGRSGSGFGNVHYCQENFWAHNTGLYVTDFKENNVEYTFHLLNGLNFSSYNSGGVQPSLNRNFIYPIKLNIPPYQQQQKIAKILSTWDKAIEKLEALIAAKQKSKKALMQQLLTGKKRFSEFEVEWRYLKANELFKTISLKNNGSADELLAVTQDQGVLPRSLLERRVVMPDGSTEGYKLVVPGNFIISLRSFQGGLEYSNYRGLVSPAYTVLKPIIKISDDFYRHYFKSYDFIGHLAVAVIGIRDGKQISYEDFSFLKLPYPPFDEQQKIASVLTAADTEIQTHQKQMSALKVQKKGLMQQLLTGKKRVNIGEAA